MSLVLLKEEEAEELRKKRLALCLSRKDLADQLYWNDAKIRAIEDREFDAVEVQDIESLRVMLGLPEIDHEEAKGKKRLNRPKIRPKREPGRKADHGKPKPRLNYDEGTRKVLSYLRKIKNTGLMFAGRRDIENATGYTGVQVRAFVKTLAAQGLVERMGHGRAMTYRAVDPDEGVEAEKFRDKYITRAVESLRRKAAKERLIPEVRKVKIPKKLRDELQAAGLMDLTLAEVWGDEER